MSDFHKALEVGRPPNIVKLFPNSKALIVSGKVIRPGHDRKGGAMTMAANGRNNFIIRGACWPPKSQRLHHHRDRRSEGGAKAYCPTNYWNMALQIDAACNELGITVPVAVHADHYGIKKESDLALPRPRSRPCSRPASPPSPSTPPTCRTTRICWPTSP